MKELQIIKHIRKSTGKPGKGVLVGIGDDCAVLEHNKKEYLLWASDMLVEGTHFKAKDAGYEKIGRKAVAVNISDIAAMGGEPKYITVSIGIPHGIKLSAARAMYKGVGKICKEHGVSVVGGDTNRSERIVIDVSILGTVRKKRLVRRSGAKEGDFVLITGPVRNGKKEHLDFKPRVEEAKYLTKNYRVSSMIDTSDGIAPDIGRICSESRVGCRLYADKVPLSRGLSLDDALYYGESFELLFTMSMKETQKLYRKMRKDKRLEKFSVIGEVTPKRSGLTIIDSCGRKKKLKMEGYCHL